MLSEKCEHMLEYAYMIGEDKKDRLGDLKAACNHRLEEGFAETLSELQQEALMELVGERIRLTDAGEQKARGLIRRHRLAERLLSDVFQIEEVDMEAQACKLEHILSPEVSESICAFLGHPPHCPHGREIPRGSCCKRFTTQISPVVVPLDKLSVGSWAKIIFTTPAYHKRYERLTILGVLPGSVLKLYQKQPSYVIKVHETEIALDSDIVREIFVRPVKDPAAALD